MHVTNILCFCKLGLARMASSSVLCPASCQACGHLPGGQGSGWSKTASVVAFLWQLLLAGNRLTHTGTVETKTETGTKQLLMFSNDQKLA